MAGITTEITVRGMRQVQQMLRRVGGVAASRGGRTGLHARFAILASRWIDRNFQSEGGMTGAPWAKLKPMTVAGRRKGSSRVLQDTGLLRASFLPQWDDQAARVGTASEISKYHEYGTKGPYIIEPKRAKALAWKVSGPFSSLKTQRLRTTKVKYSFSSLITGRTFKSGLTEKEIMGKKWINPLKYKGDYFILAKKVIHPGLPIRRMLPRMGEPTLMPELLRAALNYVKEAEQNK